MIENKDYELIPNEEENWHVRILTGEYIETVFAFEALKINPEREELTFSVEIIYTPDPDVSTDDPEFQKIAGDILFDVLENISKEQSE